MEIASYQYKDPNIKDKTVWGLSHLYFYNGSSYTCKVLVLKQGLFSHRLRENNKRWVKATETNSYNSFPKDT